MIFKAVLIIGIGSVALACGEGMSLKNKTRGFFGMEETWSKVKLELYDIHGLWGGRAIYVFGDGKALVRIVTSGDSGFVEKRYLLNLDPAHVRDLIKIFIAKDFLTIKDSERPGIPDEVNPSITAVNSSGERFTVWRWGGEVKGRFEVLCNEFLKIEEKALKTEPVFEGPYGSGFLPTE